jgi:uncharacterized membrane protein YedE/YeeE
VTGGSRSRSPWWPLRRGIVVACVLIVVGVILGIGVSSPYFGVAAFGVAVGASLFLISLLRAMRPALRRPTDVKTEDWPAHYMRTLGHPPPTGTKDGGRSLSHPD